jgi:hypothetical protein
VKDDEVGRACSLNRGEQERIYEFRGTFRKKERYHLEDKDTGEWIILKWNLEMQDGVVWTGLTWLRIGTSGGLL